ncbi:MAG: radical SAM family heme chaperone HemW [Mycobacteriales bacterium]
MPSPLPAGDPAPTDGALGDGALAELGRRDFGLYVHVPFCATRCGYCDFNTYTAAEVGNGSRAAYADAAVAEVVLARRVLGDADLPVSTVFFGGGTPSVLPAADLGRILAVIDAEFGLEPGAEVTTEANPESVDAAYLDQLAGQGFTRVSFGMQSSRPHVLAVLDRRHTPGRPERCVQWARAAGFEQVSLDLIYGAPGESLVDWRGSLQAAVAAGPDHVSAYALVVEDGTRLARQVVRGELTTPDDDDLADKYVLADDILAAAGYRWYEVSNWARPGAACRHNLGYWRGAHWWGVGPGAHSHVAGTRWWNVRHPTAYAARLAAGSSPAAGREVLTAQDRRVERVLLELRLAEGLPLDALAAVGRRAAARAVEDGLLQQTAYGQGRAALTARGRLLADAVVRDLLD